MIPSCRQATKLASKRLDHPLNFGERMALRMHLAICKSCTNAAEQFEFLRAAVQQLGSKDA